MLIDLYIKKINNKNNNQIKLEAFCVYNGNGNKAYPSELYNKTG